MGLRTIVVGAGSGGGALAARLSESSRHEVVLVEAGPDYPDPATVAPSILDPYNLAEDHFWNLEAYYVEPAADRPASPYPRGRVVGGSGSVNATVAQRGAPEDFASWVALGNGEWSWDAVLPYYRRLENDLDYGETEVHGAGGPVPIRRIRDGRPACVVAFEQACVGRGFPACDDHNDPWSTGVGPLPRNQPGEVRGSSLMTYLVEARARPNLEILAETRARRVLFDGRRAVGVEVERAGVVERLPADRVVLAAGSVHTPQLLMLSGIGPAELLRRVGIEPLVALEGVGQNLRDHVYVPILALLHETRPQLGIFSQLRFTATGGEVNDLSLFPVMLLPSQMQIDVDTGGRAAMVLVGFLSKPHSEGWLTIASADIADDPVIHLNYLDDRSDVARLAEAVRLAYDLATTPPLGEQVSEILFPDADTVADDAALEEYMRLSCFTGYHPVGTCRMGPDGDPGAVVDQRLAVRGVAGLWIADASVMPRVPTGFTNLTAYMIGERAADWLG